MRRDDPMKQSGFYPLRNFSLDCPAIIGHWDATIFRAGLTPGFCVSAMP